MQFPCSISPSQAARAIVRGALLPERELIVVLELHSLAHGIGWQMTQVSTLRTHAIVQMDNNELRNTLRGMIEPQ